MIIGLDEVGRGCWAGPLVAAAVGFKSYIPKGLTDSKLLTRDKRTVINAEILKSATFIGIGWVTPQEVDMNGISKSVRLAMTRAINKLDETEVEYIVDGNINYLAHLEKSRAIVKADLTVPQVSAASIVAKVARDSFMINLSTHYPQYLFEKHVGYGTKAHRQALEQYGPTMIHRHSFKPVLSLQKKSTPV